MARKFYVVWSGRQTGVFTDWNRVQPLVDKFPGARFKAFPTSAQAERAFRSGVPATVGATRSIAKRAASGKFDERDSSLANHNAAVKIYCDGACEPNPGAAGSGIAVYRNGTVRQLWYGLFNPNGTNNTAELNALHHALLMAEQVVDDGETVEVLSDSRYAINCISTWAKNWEKRGWRKATGEIRNLQIIQSTYALYQRINTAVPITHVNAHVGTEGNELADRMAMLAVQSKQTELRRYEADIDIASILRMRAG